MYTVYPKNDPSKKEYYVGLTATTFKDRYSAHQTSFKHEVYGNKTTLSTHVWDMKRRNIDYDIKWKILDRGKSFSPVSNICNLCTKEKYFIIFEPEKATLNKKDKLNNTCLYKNSVLLEKT